MYIEQILVDDHPSARVQPSCAPSKRSSSALTCGRSQEQPVVTGYATDPSRAARSASTFYQQRVPVNYELSRHREGLLLPAGNSGQQGFIPDGKWRGGYAGGSLVVISWVSSGSDGCLPTIAVSRVW